MFPTSPLIKGFEVKARIKSILIVWLLFLTEKYADPYTAWISQNRQCGWGIPTPGRQWALFKELFFGHLSILYIPDFFFFLFGLSKLLTLQDSVITYGKHLLLLRLVNGGPSFSEILIFLACCIYVDCPVFLHLIIYNKHNPRPAFLKWWPEKPEAESPLKLAKKVKS